MPRVTKKTSRKATRKSSDRVLRQQLIELLTGGHAHVGPKQALRGLPASLRGKRPVPGLHSVYEELEHMRLAQEDILRYTLDPDWESPPWPEGYWPKRPTPTESQWKACVQGFEADLRRLCALARRSSLDLQSKIPHGEGRTYLRQILLVADHNAYHLGQIVQTRKMLGAWRARQRSPAYAHLELPGVTEAAEEGDWARAARQAGVLERAVARNAALVGELARTLGERPSAAR